MDLFEKQPIVSGITTAVFVKRGQGTPVHKNRPSYGFAFFDGVQTAFHFENGKSLFCTSGDLIFLPKGSNYTVEGEKCQSIPANTKANAGTYAINFHLVGEATLEPFVLHIKGREEMHSLFVRAISVWQKKKVGYLEECFSIAYQILRLLRKETDSYFPVSRTLATLAPALEYIEERYLKESISIDHLASLAGVSQPYLRKLFETAFSVPPSVYIRNLRLRRACDLLDSREYSVTDAAVLSGFSDASYFSREFKKFTGRTPKDFLLGKS